MADKKITDLTALTSVAADDVMEIVDDVAGTPTSKKVTVQNLLDAPHGALTASLPVFTDGSKKLVSVAVATAFSTIKQAATDAATGVVELATAAEVLAFADTARVVTPADAGKCNTVRHTTDGSITAAQMRGHTHVVTGAATITLPAAAAGLHAKFVTIGAIAVHVKAGASDKITLKNTALDDGDKVSNNSTDGDMIEIMANAAGDDWETGIWSGTWTDGGA